MTKNIINIYTYAVDDEEKDFFSFSFSFSFSLGGGLDEAVTGVWTTLTGIGTLLIIVGCPIIFGDGGIRGCGIVILFVWTVFEAKVVFILRCDTAGVFIGTALTSICRPPPMGLGDEVDVSGGGRVLVWEDTIGGWIRMEPILLTAVRPVGVCTLTCCWKVNKKVNNQLI